MSARAGLAAVPMESLDAQGRGPLRIFLVAGEHSGDRLGGKLMTALRRRLGADVVFAGVGGEDMIAAGLVSLFPMADIAVMGLGEVAKRLRLILARIDLTTQAALRFDPHVIVIIDSPDFTHRVARRVRRARPSVPIVDYVSPTVWAWRPGRARAMAHYVDHVLALLPFEPEAHRRLGGPECTYVGHPIVERLDWIGAQDPEALRRRLGLPPDETVLAVLPGSRRQEVAVHMPVFGATLARVLPKAGSLTVVLPVAEGLEALVRAGAADWPIAPHLVHGEADKFAAFRLARAALAASGTVTLELAATGTPMVVGYLATGITRLVRPFIRTPSVVLANLILGRNAFPEFIQGDCTPEKLAGALAPILPDGLARQLQLKALTEIPKRLAPPAISPSEAAAEIVIRHGRRGRAR